MSYKLSLMVFLVALAALACGPAADSPAVSPAGSGTGSAVLPATAPPSPSSEAGVAALPDAVQPSPNPEAEAAVLPVDPPAAAPPSLGADFPTIAPTPDLPATKAALETIDAHRRQVELATRTAIEAQQEAERYAAALEATRVAELPTPTPLPTATPYPTPTPQPTYPPQPTPTPTPINVPYPSVPEWLVSRETFERFERMCLNGKLWQEPFPGGNLLSPDFNAAGTAVYTSGDYTREVIARNAIVVGGDRSEIGLWFIAPRGERKDGKLLIRQYQPRIMCIEVPLGYVLDFEQGSNSFRLTGPGNYFRLIVGYVDNPTYQVARGGWKMRYTCVLRPCGETVARMLAFFPHRW